MKDSVQFQRGYMAWRRSHRKYLTEDKKTGKISFPMDIDVKRNCPPLGSTAKGLNAQVWGLKAPGFDSRFSLTMLCPLGQVT